MKRLLVLFAALSCTLTIDAMHGDDKTLISDFYQLMLESRAEELKNPRLKYRMWDKLCNDFRPNASCQGIKPPRIFLFSPNPLRPGLAGYFDGGDVVYIRTTLYGDEREEVVAHEMSHYLDFELGLLPELPVFVGDREATFQLCLSEKVAWGVSDDYWRSAFNFRNVVGKKWTSWYKHCRPFKDRLYP